MMQSDSLAKKLRQKIQKILHFSLLYFVIMNPLSGSLFGRRKKKTTLESVTFTEVSGDVALDTYKDSRNEAAMNDCDLSPRFFLSISRYWVCLIFRYSIVIEEIHATLWSSMNA